MTELWNVCLVIRKVMGLKPLSFGISTCGTFHFTTKQTVSYGTIGRHAHVWGKWIHYIRRSNVKFAIRRNYNLL